MAKLWQFSEGHPKPAFSEKVQWGHQKNFFKNLPKSSPCLKGLKALWHKWHYPPISTHLTCKDWKRFWREKRLQKCPNGQVMDIFARSPKSRIFWKSANGKDFGAERGSKSAPMAELWQITQGHPKPAFFWKSAKRGPREIFQKSPKK